METRTLGVTDTIVPVIGMGTWNMAPPDEYVPEYATEERAIEAIQTGIEIGYSLIDTAEMYGANRTEELVGKAIRGKRDKIFLATKISPENFTYVNVLKAANESLRRLGTGIIDLYQLHWPNPYIPVRETMSAMESLVDDGLVRFIGVSNFSVGQLKKAQNSMKNHPIMSNQVRYNLLVRNKERELLPYAKEQRITIIAYSPFETGEIFEYKGKEIEVAKRLAAQYDKSLAQLCLN
jgi:diketogulonate reductase-like aldo/keto reductase